MRTWPTTLFVVTCARIPDQVGVAGAIGTAVGLLVWVAAAPIFESAAGHRIDRLDVPWAGTPLRDSRLAWVATPELLDYLGGEAVTVDADTIPAHVPRR